MNRKYRYICLFLIILVSLRYGHQTTEALPFAPNVIFTTITGQKISLKNLRGHPVLINFWATNCKSCVEEIPDLIDLYHRYHPQGLEMIAIAMFYDLPNHVVAMANAQQIPYPIALDIRAEQAKAFGEVQLTPTTFLINPDGQIIFKKTGRFDKKALAQRIQLFTQRVNRPL
jgi:peroxiredoxin